MWAYPRDKIFYLLAFVKVSKYLVDLKSIHNGFIANIMSIISLITLCST